MVGAGIAGLTAARMLAYEGIEVVVLEGRDRVGGRIHTVDLAGATVDLGGAWIVGDSRNPVSQLVDGLGLTTDGHDVTPWMFWDDVAGRPLDLAEATAAADQAEALTGPLGWLSRRQGQDVNAQQVIDRFMASKRFDPALERHVRFMVEQLYFELEYAGPTTEFAVDRFNQDEWFGPDYHLVDGGFGPLIDWMAEGLDVRLGQRVERVGHDEDQAWVTTAGGETLTADRVIVTVPLGVLASGSIRFEPELPAAKREALARLDMGNLEKVLLRFDERFWGNDERGVWCFIGAERGEFPMCIDLSFHAGAPTLLLFHGGQRVRDILDQRSDAELVSEALAVLERLFGARPPQPIASLVTRWNSDPFTLGAYSYPSVGSSEEDHVRLAEPMGDRILFAGEGTMPGYFGTVHGAMMSGMREGERLGASRTGLPGLG